MPEKFFALLAAIGNSRAARSARAKLQWRDRAGRFAEMGRGYKFKIRRANGRIVNLNGVFVGVTESPEFGQVYVKNDPSGLPDGFYQVAGSNAQEIVASLTPEMLESRGIVVGQDAQGNALGDWLAEEIQNEAEIVRLDAPLGWARDENVSNRFVTEDGELEIVEMDDNRFMVNRLDNDEPAREAFSWADALGLADRLDAEADGVSLPSGQRAGQPVEPFNEDGSQEYPNLLERVRARGRLSLDTSTGNLVNEGYLVGVDGFEKQISAEEFYSPQGLDALGQYIVDNKAELGSEGGKRLSVWHDRDAGLVSFDIVQQVADLDEATRLGRDGGQSVVRDMANDRDVSLDGTSSEGGDDGRQVDGDSGSGESAGDVEGGDSPVAEADARESGEGGDGEPEPELDGLGQPIPRDRAGLEQRVGFLERQRDRFKPERPGPNLEDIEAAREDIQARLDNFDAPAEAAPEPVEAPVDTDTPEVVPEPVAEIPEAPAVEPSVTPAADLSDDELKAEISDAVGPSDETPDVDAPVAPEPEAEDVSEPSATPVADLSDEGIQQALFGDVNPDWEGREAEQREATDRLADELGNTPELIEASWAMRRELSSTSGVSRESAIEAMSDTEFGTLLQYEGLEGPRVTPYKEGWRAGGTNDDSIFIPAGTSSAEVERLLDEHAVRALVHTLTKRWTTNGRGETLAITKAVNRRQSGRASGEERTFADEYVDAVYANTQEALAARGITSVKLYRGLQNVAPGAERTDAAVASWTTRKEQAEFFARLEGGTVLERDVPASDIFSIGGIGPGSAQEREVLVMAAVKESPSVFEDDDFDAISESAVQVATISQVLNLPEDLKNVEIEDYFSGDFEEVPDYVRAFTNPDEYRIYVNSDMTDSPNAAVHEFGHIVFATELPNLRKDTRGIFLAVQATPTYMKLMTADDALFGEGVREYLLDPDETLARIFDQYIALRSGNQQQLDFLSQEPGQWDSAEFEPVAVAMDKFFEKVGWKQADAPEAQPEIVVAPVKDLSNEELIAEVSSNAVPTVTSPANTPRASPAPIVDADTPDEAPTAAGWAVNPNAPTLEELESAPEGSRVKRTHKESFDEMSFQKVDNQWSRVMQDGSISPVIVYLSEDFDSPRNFFIEVQESAPAASAPEANAPTTDEVMDAQPQFTPEAPDFDAEQAPPAVTVRQRDAISAIRPYDADGNLERRILEGATSEEILELLEVNLQWNANQMEAMAGRFEDMPRAAEKARRDGYEREQKAIVDLDKPDPVPFVPAPIVSPDVNQEEINAQIALAREAKIAADKVRNDFLDSLVPGRVLTREELAMLPLGSIVESLSGPSGVRHGLDVSRAQKDLRGTFIQVGRFVPEDGLSSIDAARQLFQFSPERRMENGEEITLVSVPATLARPAGVVPAPAPQVVNTGLGRESLPNNTRVSPEGSDKVLTKTGPNSFVDEDNKPVSVPAGVPLVVVPDAPASEDSDDGDLLPAIPAAPGAALTIGETKIGIMISAARGRLDSEDFAVIEERLQRPMALEAFNNFMTWLGLQPQRPNKRTEPRNTDIPALPGNKDMQTRKVLPEEEEDLNLVIEDILANFPNNRRLANGDIVIASREVNGRKFDVVVRRTPDERFFVYRRVVMPDGSIVAAKVYGEAHSYKALTGKMGSALQWLFARDPYRAITRMKNREALGSEDAKFQADANSDAVNNAASASELRNAVRDMVEHLAKEARNGRNVIDILKKSFPDGVAARAAKRGLIDSQLAEVRDVPGDGGPTHIPYGGGESLKPGDTVQWTDWRTNSPTYGQVFEGFVRSLTKTARVLMPNGEYKYTDYVDAVFPEYNRLKNDPKPMSRGRDFVSSNLRVAAPGEPLEPFFAKREEIQENQRRVAQAGDFNLPDPNAPAPQPRAPAAPKKPLVRKVAPSGLLESPDVAPEAQGLVPQTRFDFVAEVANADAFKVRAADVTVGDVTVVQNDSNLDVYAKITKKTIVDGNLELEMIIDDFDDYKIKTYVLPLMFPMTFDVFRAKPLPAEDTEKQAIRRLVMAKGPDNSVLSDADLESALEELNTVRAKELISALLSLPEWVPDEAMQVEDILRALGAKDTDRANVVAAMQNLGVDSGATVARPLTTQQLRVKAIADRFQVLKTLSIQNVRVGDIVSNQAGGTFQIIEVSRRSDRPGQLKTVSVNVDTLEPVTTYFETEESGLDRAPAVFNVKRIKDNFADWYGLQTPTRINALNADTPDPDETDAEWFGGYAEKAQALEAALNEGWDVKASINRGAQNGGVQFVKPAADYSDPEFPDPEVGAVFVKYAADKDTRDAEYLGGAMLTAMGMEGLTVGLRDDESIVVMNRINGVSPTEWTKANGMLGSDDAELLDELVSSGFSKNIRAIGLFDLLAGNGDRHRGNWMIKEDGQPVAIDNGLANNAGMGIVSLSPFGKIAFPMVRGNLVKSKALYTEAELIGVRQRLAALEDTFAAMNRSDWYRGIMRNMDSMIGRYL